MQSNIIKDWKYSILGSFHGEVHLIMDCMIWTVDLYKIRVYLIGLYREGGEFIEFFDVEINFPGKGVIFLNYLENENKEVLVCTV